MFEKYHQAIKYLEGLSNVPVKEDYMRGKAKDPTIYVKRMQWFLDALGNPEQGFKYIHITGTAGKGTVSTMIQQALVKSGKRTGLFTSPFVITSIEKIQVDDLYIAPDEFADIVEEMKPVIDRAFAESPFGAPSYFERFLAIAFLYFKQQKCEWVVLEVGCGGRYDATNVIPAPQMSAITNVDYDHMHILGKTLTKIAWDKSGIIKKGSRFFTTETRPRLRKIMEDICKEQGAEFNYIKGGNKELVGAMGFIPVDVQLPARFEMVQQNPRVILDGAHNRAKIRHTVEQLKKIPYKKLHVVVALAANKERSILDELFSMSYAVYPTKFSDPGRASMDPTKFKPGARAFSDPYQALDAALRAALPEDLVLITGSFYLAGELRTRWYSEEEILVHRWAFSKS